MDSFLVEPDFEFPEGLDEMSDGQKEALFHAHKQHTASDAASSWDVVELSPSEVIDPDKPKPKPKQNQEPAPSKLQEEECKKSSPFKFDPKLGYVVDGEDKLFLLSRGIDTELAGIRFKEPPKPRPKGGQKFDIAATAEREAEERFGKLIIEGM